MSSLKVKILLDFYYNIMYNINMCRYSLVVESHASDLMARVRFPLPAPVTFLFELFYRTDRYEINQN